MNDNVIDTIEVDGTFMVDRRINKINATPYSRRSDDKKPENRHPAYGMVFGSHLGKKVDIKI